MFLTRPRTREEFLRAVKHYCAGLIVPTSCPGEACEYAYGDPDHQCNTHFSYTQCGSCGSPLASDRHTVVATVTLPDDGIDVLMYVCADCLTYRVQCRETPTNQES